MAQSILLLAMGAIMNALPLPNGSGIFSSERKRAIVLASPLYRLPLLKTLAADYPGAELYSVDTAAEARFRVEGVHYVEHDVCEAIPRQLCGTDSAIIFNLAAVHTTPGHEDWEYYHTNVLGACNVCRYASEIGARQIVFTSSISVYGPGEAPKDEDTKITPVSAYGRSKMMAEAIHELCGGARR